MDIDAVIKRIKNEEELELGTCKLLGDVAREYKSVCSRLDEALSKLAAMESQKDNCWNEGVPRDHWADEWFIARLDTGERVVLTALPEEYSYDFKTADETYYKAYRVKSWMQFPDSQYTAQTVPVDKPAVAVPNDWREAVQEFVDRCEKGEIKSRYTYDKFKALLDCSPSHSQQSAKSADGTDEYNSEIALSSMIELCRHMIDVLDRCPSHESEQQNKNTEGK